MMTSRPAVSTGRGGLDAILGSLRLGDNVVWRVDRVDDYRSFVVPYVAAALAAGRRVVYVRFARHPRLLEPDPRVTVHDLDAYRGFESFTVRLHTIIGQEGREAFYVFDCLSSLLDAWATDVMIGNFFAVTCPYLFELDTVAYFALERESHSFATVARIRATTQLLIDLHHCPAGLYLHPLKVWERFSPTMFLPHRVSGEAFVPLTSSIEATELFVNLHRGDDEAAGYLDHWHRLCIRALELASGDASEEERRGMVEQLCRILIGREPRMLALALEHFSLRDLLRIQVRLLGTGFIGGKAVGMLLARAILTADREFDWHGVLEPHDSWHVGSDLFHHYIVHNGLWRRFMEQKTEAGYFSGAAALREGLLAGAFPPEIREEFRKMLEYFGQYPIIVRSSSLLEDGFGNAFAGKYDSFFCVNQGATEERLEQFEEAVRRIYASTMSEEALSYRLRRGLAGQDEQMALLVQRVSGAYRGAYFFPDLAGVGVSYNTYVWSRQLDPRAGMLRLVLGLGTRAVDRVEGDYPRLVPLDRPRLTPHGTDPRFTQREVDLLDIQANAWRTVPLRRLQAEGLNLHRELLFEPDREAASRQAERGSRVELPWLLTFGRLLGATTFPETMGRMLATLERHYDYPVDVEFTANVAVDGTFRVNLLQCRPLQTRGVEGRRVEIPTAIPDDQVFFRSAGNFMGGSAVIPLKRVISVDPEGYTLLSLQDKYAVARLVGRLTRLSGSREKCPVLLMGPGRWGTTTPSLGVPVSFAEIAAVAVLCEVAFSAGGLMPELSFGSHFFQDLVEGEIFYAALFPDRPECVLNRALLGRCANRLAELVPDEERFGTVVAVWDLPAPGLVLLADIVSQQLVCADVSCC